ncbi:hypothetical protein [Bradyrhizobium sp. I1.7.5]|uniref:IS1096 element passenger TnpR family protein n=1 Tax=Bradyrhizobium sp. I1.7.5 TaxID=3156363 RepID=UPI003396A0B2
MIYVATGPVDFRKDADVAPPTLRLDRLHLTLQAAFGWTNSHRFEFRAGEQRWGIPDPDGDLAQPIDASKARLSDIVQKTGANTIHYLYDSDTAGTIWSNSENGSTTRR